MTRIRLQFIAILLLASFATIAQQINMNIVVIHPNGKKFTLYINDQKINNEPEAIVKAYNINEGWCKLKAEVAENNIVVTDSFLIKPIEKNNNKEITLSFSEQNRNGKTYTHFDFITISEQSGPKQPIVPELPVYLSKLAENAVFGNLYQIINNKPVFFLNYDSTTTKCRVNLEAKDIEHFQFLISKTNDFGNRILFTKKAVTNNCYTVAQLAQLLTILETEMDKLKLAKIGYYHLTDKENAKNITNIFKFKTMTEDYIAFLKNTADENYQKALNCKEPVSETKFNEFYVSIVKEKYEYEKAATANKYIMKNCFSSAQIKKIIDIFSHDREKLELAKAAYPVVTDKENYKMLEESFLFSENKKQFLNFISK